MFKKVLVANRGEIALRVMRTCREMGISCVAVYSDVDRAAIHVRYADEAYLLGSGAPKESYLNIERIIDIARRCGAEAIHPGYGFLAENAAFVDACNAVGIVFIGPSSETMRIMGDKVAARRLVASAGVPVVPGEDNVRTALEALTAAERLGYPVLIKAVAGGGGKGIRVVHGVRDMEAALSIAGSEAASAFGDHNLYIEKLLEPVRHVEVQFVADGAGNVLVFGERECSIQRRHQKLVEESPSTALSPSQRESMCSAAVTVARASGYANTGTVEFLLDADGEFYFLEINSRLQVEHPVTEMISGMDLVAEQIRVAAGEGLSRRQEEIVLNGWALECRITAENPYDDFLPSLGRVDYVSEPNGPGIRVDSALYAGGELPYYYDPMVAKVIAWGRTRDEAICRMRRALREFVVVGVDTNIPFHLQLLDDRRFLDGQIHTRFLDDFTMVPVEQGDERKAALAVAAVLTHQKTNHRALATPTTEDGSRWRSAGRLAEARTTSWMRGPRWGRSTG